MLIVVRVDTAGIPVDTSQNITVDTTGLQVSTGEIGGAGRIDAKRPAMPYWWHSYIEQWLDELDGKWQERERKRKEQQQAEQARRFDGWRVAQERKREEELRRAVEEAERRRLLDAQFQRQLAAIRAEQEAAEAADAERVKAALTQRDARIQAAREREDEEELRRLQGIARNPRRRFEQRFEAAITAARKQGWRVKT